jgi:hypothetical protein
MENYTDICESFQRSVHDFDSTGRNLIALFPLIYGAPTLVLDVFILKFLVSKKGREEFGNIFFTIFAISAVVVRFLCEFFPKLAKTVPYGLK